MICSKILCVTVCRLAVEVASSLASAFPEKFVLIQFHSNPTNLPPPPPPNTYTQTSKCYDNYINHVTSNESNEIRLINTYNYTYRYPVLPELTLYVLVGQASLNQSTRWCWPAGAGPMVLGEPGS